MEVWAWIVAYIVGFSLLQLLVYRYVRDEEASVEGSSAPGVESYSAPVDKPERAPAVRSDGGEGTHCPQCGTFNEGDTFRYCRECVSPLR
jgi:hypothetical protein